MLQKSGKILQRVMQTMAAMMAIQIMIFILVRMGLTGFEIGGAGGLRSRFRNSALRLYVPSKPFTAPWSTLGNKPSIHCFSGVPDDFFNIGVDGEGNTAIPAAGCTDGVLAAVEEEWLCSIS